MAWEKLNRKRSKPNHLKTTDKNPRLTVGGGGEGRERKTGTNLPPPPQLSLPFNEKKNYYDSALPICSESEQS